MIKKVQLKLIFIFFIGLFFSIDCLAQKLSRADRRAIAERAIEDLENGSLVLRLKSKRNKIRELNKLLANPDLNVNNVLKSRLKKKLERTIADRDRYNLILIKAFETHYTFSDVYYMYDTATISLRDGERKGIFLNEKMELDPSIEMKEGPFFIMRGGNTDNTTTTGISGLVVMNAELEDMQRPFPYFTRSKKIDNFFRRLFFPKKFIGSNANDAVKQFERNLYKYAAKVSG